MRSFTALTRILLVLLSLCLVLSAFAACATEEEDDEVLETEATDESGSDDSLDDDLYDENGYLKDQIPDEDLNYENKELKILCWASVANEFGCDEATGSVINNALVTRDINVEDRLGVTLNYLMDQIAPGSATVTGHYVDLVRLATQSGDLYDLMALYGRTAAILSSNGYLQNILNIDYSYLNFENPWWTPTLLDELVVGNSLYMISGDITPSIYEQPYTMFYNVDMVKDYGLKDPYDCVKDNTWTMETFRQTIKNITVDQSGTQMYGLVSSYYTVPSLMHGCGVRIMDMDENQIPRLSEDLFSEKTIDIVDDLQAWNKEDNFLVDSTSANARVHFTSGNAMFLIDRVLECFNFVENCNFSYSVVPNPKLTSEQDRYYTTLDTQLTFFCLMRGLSQDELTIRSAVLECMASEGYRLTSPAVVDSCIKSRYAQTEEMSEMLGLVVDSVYYDFGRIYSASDDSYICDRVGKVIQSSTETWSGYGQAMKTSLETRFQKLVDKFIEMEKQ